MKFAEYLSSHVTPEWRKQYINYEEMKELLSEVVEEHMTEVKRRTRRDSIFSRLSGSNNNNNDVETPESLSAESKVFEQFDRMWFKYCEDELTKINTFFNEKLAEAKVKYTTLCEDLHAYRTSDKCHHNGLIHDVRHHSSKAIRLLSSKNKKGTKHLKINDLKLAFSEFYLSLVLLQNYQKLNFTGFRKIQKKHDKLLMRASGKKWKETFVDSAPFMTNKENDQLIEQVEHIVINELEKGDRPKAMKRLRVPPLGRIGQNPWITFKVGLYTGACIILLAAIILTALFDPDHGMKDYRIIFRLYRGPFLLIVFLFFMSFNIYGWRASGVNHVLIFELDPRRNLSELHLMEMAAIFAVLWLLSLLGYLYSSEMNIPLYTSPLVLVVFLVGFLLNPTKTCHHNSRFWLLRVLGRIICAPFFYVGFADFWLADQLNSLVQVLLDTQYIICFYASSNGEFEYNAESDSSRCVANDSWLIRAFIAILPAWFRFMQCMRRYSDTKEAFPHLVNAGKYSTTFFVLIFSTLASQMAKRAKDAADDYDEDNESNDTSIFFYCWILAAVTSSIYAYIWDMKMDWGLFDSEASKGAKKNKFLRKEIVYRKSFYYFGIIEDLVLRFGWVLSASLTELDFIHNDILISILTPLELFRRFVWNFFRLENEHLNNCGKFRAVRDISISALHV